MIRELRGAASAANKIRKSGDLPGALAFAGLSAIRSQRPVTVNLKSFDVTLRPCTTDFYVAEQSFAGEFDELAAMSLKHNFIIDAGGCIGTSAIVLARAFPAAKIVSIEPSKENFLILQRNVAPYPNIVPVNKALGASKGIISLVDRGTGHWGFSTVQAPADAAQSMPMYQVEVITIPEIMSAHGASAIDILKLDIEGAELDLLKPRPAWLDSVDILLAELHDRIAPGCEAAFDEATAGRRNRPGGWDKILSIRN